MRLCADDMSCSTETVEEALNIHETSKKILAQQGFNLRKWNSNNKVFLSKIKEGEDKSPPITFKGSSISEDDQSYSQYIVGNPSEGGALRYLV